jgi:hypothetical protein
MEDRNLLGEVYYTVMLRGYDSWISEGLSKTQTYNLLRGAIQYTQAFDDIASVWSGCLFRQLHGCSNEIWGCPRFPFVEGTVALCVSRRVRTYDLEGRLQIAAETPFGDYPSYRQRSGKEYSRNQACFKHTSSSASTLLQAVKADRVDYFLGQGSERVRKLLEVMKPRSNDPYVLTQARLSIQLPD